MVTLGEGRSLMDGTRIGTRFPLCTLFYVLDFGTKLMFYIIIKLNESFIKLTTGCPVVRTRHFHFCGPGLIFVWRAMILHTVYCGQNNFLMFLNKIK